MLGAVANTQINTTANKVGQNLSFDTFRLVPV